LMLSQLPTSCVYFVILHRTARKKGRKQTDCPCDQWFRPVWSMISNDSNAGNPPSLLIRATKSTWNKETVLVNVRKGSCGNR
jgi:hypothetical protein